MSKEKGIAVFSPGPAFSDPEVRKVAGWVAILDRYKEALVEMGYTVFVPTVEPALLDKSSTVSKILSYDLLAADQLPSRNIDLFLGPPGYSTIQMGRLPRRTKKFLYVWNNADWYRDQMLAEEYAAANRPYDLSLTWRWINQKALVTADHIIACSPWVKMTHAEVVPAAKISITPWGVDSETFQPGLPTQAQPLKVLFVGGDPLRKGLGFLLRAMDEMQGDRTLIIAGCQVFKDDVNELPREGGTLKIIQLGMMPYRKMPEIMHQAHVICIPTLEDGIACALQEGMACGLVPVTTPECAEVFDTEPWWEEGMETPGYLVNYRDVHGLTQVLQVLSDNVELREEMAKAAVACARRVTWEDTKASLKKVIQEQMGDETGVDA